MSRVLRAAVYALALLFLLLLAVTTASAQTPQRRYGFCYGLAGNPRVENVTLVFDVGPSGPPGSRAPEFINALRKKHGGFITQEIDCPMFPTAAEAEANRREVVDGVRKVMGSTPIADFDFIPQGATALSTSALVGTPASPATATKPQTPPASTPAAPAAPASQKLDYLGRPIPTTAYWVCDSRLRKYLYSTAPFFAGTDGPTVQDIFKTFVDHMIKLHNEGGTSSCNKYATQAEAQASIDRQSAQAPSTGYQFQKIDWTYKPGTSAAATPAPASTAKPATTPAVTPKPSPAAVAPPPSSSAPAKPTTPANKSTVFVICRSEGNTDRRRFYNPPVDGRGASYPEWQSSFHAYLVKEHGFKGSEFGCGHYPTLEAAQKDYDEWITRARSQPTINGLASPIIITKWKY